MNEKCPFGKMLRCRTGVDRYLYCEKEGYPCIKVYPCVQCDGLKMINGWEKCYEFHLKKSNKVGD